MSINSLERIINTTLLTKISKTSSSASSSKSSLSSSSNEPLVGQALYNSLRSGAQNFAAGIQLLNSSATFVNLSLDTTERLLDIIKQLETIASKANKGNISGSSAKQMRDEFEKMAKGFDKLIDGATQEDTDLFDVEQLQGVLTSAGLDPEKVSELALALKRFTHPAEATIGEDGEVSSNGNPVPLADFQRALRAAIVDPDDPTDDRSGFFGRVKSKISDIRIQLETNLKALKDTTTLIGDNISLARAAGFAFLDVSNEMTGRESAEAIAEQLRQKIRASARPLLGQAHNLEPVLVAGMAAVSVKKETN
jgi:hypothetical protein